MKYILFQIADLLNIHKFIYGSHELHQPIIQLSIDGVQESKSSSISLDIFCVKFEHCRNVYPIRIIRPCEKYRYDEQAEIEKVLEDINANEVVIDCAVCDKPKRSTILCAKGHSAKFPCEYCESCAVTHVLRNKSSSSLIEKTFQLQCRAISKQIKQIQENQDDPNESEEEIDRLRETLAELNAKREKDLQKSAKKQLTWPSSTMSGNHRTPESIRAIVTEIENNPNIVKNDEFCKGIKGKSLFLDQPLFHIINDAPCEYMHLVCLGMVKRLVEMTFKVGGKRERITKRKLTPPQLFNEKIKNIQVVREFSRRCRNMDFSTLKAAEFRNILLFFFPIVLECIDNGYPDEKRIWLHLVFMIRACVIPNEEFQNVNVDILNNACKKFYSSFEKAFGPTNCTYSIHVGSSHLLKVRGDMPLTHKSAFKFENFYSEMKNLFHPGTVSPLKQILQNCYVKRIIEFHCCEKETFYSPEKKPEPGKKFNPGKENNSLIYTYNNEDQTYKMYIIDEIIDHSRFRCRIQGKFKMKIELTPQYDWSSVGVFKIGAISEEVVIVNRKSISGKVIQVNDFLITCPYNVLHEQ